MELSRFLGIVVRWSWLIILLAAAAAATTWVMAGRMTKEYQADSLVLVGSLTATELQQQLAYQQLAQTYASLALTRPVVERVGEALGLPDSPSALADRLDASALSGQALIKVTAKGADPESAAELANGLSSEIVKLDTAAGSAQPLISIVEPAVAPSAPSAPPVLMFTVIAGVLGGAVGLGLALILDHVRVRRRQRLGQPDGQWVPWQS